MTTTVTTYWVDKTSTKNMKTGTEQHLNQPYKEFMACYEIQVNKEKNHEGFDGSSSDTLFAVV